MSRKWDVIFFVIFCICLVGVVTFLPKKRLSLKEVKIGEIDNTWGRKIYDGCYRKPNQLALNIRVSTEIFGFSLLEFPLASGADKGYETLFFMDLEENRFLASILLSGLRPYDGKDIRFFLSNGTEEIPLKNLVRERRTGNHPKELIFNFTRMPAQAELKNGLSTQHVVSVIEGTGSLLNLRNNIGNPYQSGDGLQVNPEDLPKDLLQNPRYWKLILRITSEQEDKLKERKE